MINFLLEAGYIKEEIIKIRREIHKNLELGFEEFETSKLIKEFLALEGINFKSISKTGIVGIIEGKASGG